MFKKITSFILCIFALYAVADTTIATVPAELMAKAKVKASSGAEKRLVQLAQEKSAFIKEPFLSVVNNKVLVAASGDPHDYISVGPYFWPDPSKPDGKPWIEKDGQFNPTRTQYDNGKMSKMAYRTEICALLWHFKRDKEAAEYAVKQLEYFFVAPETRMNPHLKYGQSVPGKVDGRPAGMIDALELLKVIDAVSMLSDYPGYTKELHAGLQKWFKQYATWMRTDKMAKKDWPVRQNHGLSYHTQIAAYMAFAGDMGAARGHLNILKKRIVESIREDGIQPAEVRRTNGWSYSNYALMIIMQGVGVGKNIGFDLLNAEELSGIRVRAAVDYLIQFIKNPEKWPYKEIIGFSANRLSQILAQMYYHTGEKRYLDAYNSISGRRIRENRVTCFFVPPEDVVAK